MSLNRSDRGLYFYVFKRLRLLKILVQAAAAHSLSAIATSEHVCSLRRVFRHAHVAPENKFDLISPLKRRTIARRLCGEIVLTQAVEDDRTHSPSGGLVRLEAHI